MPKGHLWEELIISDFWEGVGRSKSSKQTLGKKRTGWWVFLTNWLSCSHLIFPSSPCLFFIPVVFLLFSPLSDEGWEIQVNGEEYDWLLTFGEIALRCFWFCWIIKHIKVIWVLFSRCIKWKDSSDLSWVPYSIRISLERDSTKGVQPLILGEEFWSRNPFMVNFAGCSGEKDLNWMMQNKQDWRKQGNKIPLYNIVL